METFKFKFVQNGSTKGFFASKGAATADGLKLDKHTLPYECVTDSTNRDSRLILQIDRANPKFPNALTQDLWESSLVLDISGGAAEKLEREIDRHSSKIEAERHKQALEQAGRGREFRVVECPCCAATVDLSEYPTTPYIYCRFCEAVFDKSLRQQKDAQSYRRCDECGFYDRVQGYGEFYFYFLIILYGFSHKRRHLCDDCGASLANKLLALNALFLLGVPNAIVCAIRARAGKDATLSTLSKANHLAKNNKLSQADKLYEQALNFFPNHPGIRYNQAQAYLFSNQGSTCIKHLKLALEACPNYLPAQALAYQLSQAHSE